MIGRLRLALGQRSFQLVMVAWASLLVGVLAFPAPQGFGVDGAIYRHALERMWADQPAYMVVDAAATAASDGRQIYFFPPPPAAIVGGLIWALPGGPMAWLAVNLALMAAAFMMMRRITPPIASMATYPRWLRVGLALAAWFLFMPSIHQLWFGNQQSIVLVGLAMMALGLVREQAASTGVGLAVATVVKWSPGLFVLPLLVARRFAEVAWAAGAGVLLFAVSLLVVGPGPWIDFADALAAGSDQVAGQGYNIAPLGGTLPSIPAVAWVAITAVAMALTGRLQPRTMLVTSIVVFLLGWPVQWPHYAVIALVAMALLLPDERTHIALGVAYVLLNAPWREAWTIALVVLLIAALRPAWLRPRWLVGHASDPTPAAPPAPAAPPGPAALG